MESCLSLLEDCVLTQAKPISISTLLDLSPPSVTLSCARRSLAQFAIDHRDSVSVTLAVSFIAENSSRLEVRLIRLDDLTSLSGKILSSYVYCIERVHATSDSMVHADNSDKSKDREKCLVTYRMSMEQELPMLIREPPIHYPNGGPQRRQKAPEKVSEPVVVKRKIEESKEEKVAKAAKQGPTEKTKDSSFKQNNGKRKKNGTKVTEMKQAETKKGVAVKKAKNPDRKPVAMPGLMSDDDTELSDEDRPMEIDHDEEIRAESEPDEAENVDNGKDENEAPPASPKTALTKKVVHHTYVQDKYLVTENRVQMVKTDVSDQKRNTSNNRPSSSKTESVKPKSNASAKAKGKSAAKGKSVQTSMTSYFSKR